MGCPAETIKERPRATVIIAVLSCLLLFDSTLRTRAQTGDGSKGTGFMSAQEAVNALISAAETYDEKSLAAILGANSNDIIHTGESVRDKETR